MIIKIYFHPADEEFVRVAAMRAAESGCKGRSHIRPQDGLTLVTDARNTPGEIQILTEDGRQLTWKRPDECPPWWTVDA